MKTCFRTARAFAQSSSLRTGVTWSDVLMAAEDELEERGACRAQLKETGGLPDAFWHR
jgi:hypothetical protein